MLRKILLRTLCIFTLLQIVFTHDHVGEFLKKLRADEKNLAPQWIATYLQTLRNLHMPKNVTLSDLRSLERLLKYLKEDKSNELHKYIDIFLKEFIQSNFKFENERKSDENSKIVLSNETERDSNSEETFEEEDLQKSESLHQIFTDLFLLKSKLKNFAKELPSIIEEIDKYYDETNEEQLKDMKVNVTDNSTENVSLLSKNLEWIREKTQNLTNMLFQSPVFEYIRNLKDYLVQRNATEFEGLEEEIEYLLKELEESEEEDFKDLLNKSEKSEDSFMVKRNKMEAKNLSEVEKNYSGNLSQALKSQISEDLENVEITKETNRKGRKLFKKINKDKEMKPVLNNTKYKESIVWKKTFRIFGEDKGKRDQPKDQPKETLDKDEKWKIEAYNKIFKDENTDMENDLVDKINHVENATKRKEITKENIEKLFGNKNETKSYENEKWNLKKGLKTFLNRENETLKNENEKLELKGFKKFLRENETETNENEKLFGSNETGNQSQKITETGNSLKEKSWKENVYDKIISKSEIIGNKTNNVTNYILNLTNQFQAGGNNESLLKKISEDIKDSKENVTNYIRNITKYFEKGGNKESQLRKVFEDITEAKENFTNYLGNITNYFKTGGNNESQLRKIFKEISDAKENVTQFIKEKLDNVTKNIFQSGSKFSQDSKIKPEGDENKWPLNYLNEKLLNTKENFIYRVKEKSDAVIKHLNHIKTDISMEGSPAFLTKTKLISLSLPVGENQYKHMESSTYTTITSTYYTVLLTNTTKNLIYQKTVTFTSTEVLEIPLSTSHTKNLSVDKMATKKYLKKQIQSSLVTTKNTETKSKTFKDGIIDKFNRF